MQLLRPLVLLALLTGTSGRPSRSKRSQYSAILLGTVQTQQNVSVSLADASDKLQGVLDAVVASITQARNGLKSIRSSCVTQVESSATRQEVQKEVTAELSKDRQLNIERTAGLEALLAHLVKQETDAHQSYESSVAQRAAALQKHLSSNKATIDQANAVGSVLEMMKQKRALITAGQTSTDNFTVATPVVPTSSGSALDFIIGVLQSMQDNSMGKADEASEKHNKDDADMERLVTSYKATLQHIDVQYQTQNARRMKAKTTARNAGEEMSLRNMLVDGDSKLFQKFVDLCGVKGKGGSVPASIDATDYLLKQFEQQTRNALFIMDTLPDLVISLLSIDHRKKPRAFLSLESRSGVAKLASVEVPKQTAPRSNASEGVSDAVSARESAARWVIAQAARVKDHVSERLANQVEASFPHGVPPVRRAQVHVMEPSQLVHTLIGAARAVQSAGQAAQISPAKQNAAIIACVKDKQDYTDKILAARQAARVARTDRMSAEARVTATGNFKVLASDQKAILQSEMKQTEIAWKPLRDVVATGNFTQTMSDAIAEMSSIDQDVQTYLTSGGPPGAAGLPGALNGIRTTLAEVKTRLETDMQALDSSFTGSFMISFSALINQLTSKVDTFDQEKVSAKAALSNANTTANAEELKVKDLMLARAGVEFQCLHNGTCANLHYQQCCDGGSGTYTKLVDSWSECADHCESMIKEGKQIVGCEILYIASDDPSTTGTCFAQTLCNLKATKTKCAGSLCKVLPR